MVQKQIKFYILGPENNGDGVYHLLTEKGEALASHFCSSLGFAKGDLEARRPERQKKWKKEFGKYKVLHLGEDKMTAEKLLKLNEELYNKRKNTVKRNKIESKMGRL